MVPSSLKRALWIDAIYGRVLGLRKLAGWNREIYTFSEIDVFAVNLFHGTEDLVKRHEKLTSTRLWDDLSLLVLDRTISNSRSR